MTDVINAVLEHRYSFDAYAESKAGVLIGIDAGNFKNMRMDHSGTKDLDPASSLAGRASLSSADMAGNVDLN